MGHRRNGVASRRRPVKGRRFAARFARPCRAALDWTAVASLSDSEGCASAQPGPGSGGPQGEPLNNSRPKPNNREEVSTLPAGMSRHPSHRRARNRYTTTYDLTSYESRPRGRSQPWRCDHGADVGRREPSLMNPIVRSRPSRRAKRSSASTTGGASTRPRAGHSRIGGLWRLRARGSHGSGRDFSTAFGA
jgi:hypothetical protein